MIYIYLYLPFFKYKTINRTLDNFGAMFNRKWYVVQKATDEETLDELRNRNVKEATEVKFLCDKTYPTVPNTRIQPFGNT